jgi:hypothetical protein
MDLLLLVIDSNLNVVRDRENAGYAMRAADLIELAVARRITVRGRWVNWLHVIDSRPTGEPLLDASLAAIASAAKPMMATDFVFEQPYGGAVSHGLTLLQAQGAVRLYSRQLSRRLTLVEPVLLDWERQAEIRARLDRYVAAGPAADVLDWALAGLVYEGSLWIPGPFDRAAWRTYKEAAHGSRGKSGAGQVEAAVRIMTQASRYARNRDP